MFNLCTKSLKKDASDHLYTKRLTRITRYGMCRVREEEALKKKDTNIGVAEAWTLTLVLLEYSVA